MNEWFLPLDQLKLLHRLWSVRLAFVGAALEGAYCVIPAFQYYVSPFQLLGISIGVIHCSHLCAGREPDRD